MPTGPVLPLATEELYLGARVAESTISTVNVITFVVAGETYGLPISDLREIIKTREITEVPRGPSFLLGIITLRGLIIPVLDLRIRLRFEPTPVTRAARILVVGWRGDLLGLLVDAVTGVVRLGADAIESAPSTLSVGDSHQVSGIGRYLVGRKTKMVILLDLGAVADFDIHSGTGRRGFDKR